MSKFVLTPLKYIVADRISNGVGLPAEHENPDWPRYIRTTDIAGPRALRDNVWYSQPPELLKQAGVEPGDLLLTNAGATVGKAYLHTSDESAVFAGYLTRVRPDPLKADSRYVAYCCESQTYWDQIHTGATRSTIDNFSSGKYQDLRIPFPPRDTQRRIADMLDTETARIDTLIEKHCLLISGLQRRFGSQLEQSLAGWAFGDITVPRSVESLAARIPAGWQASRLEAITTAVQDTVSLAEMADAGEVVHYTIEELGDTGRPRRDRGADIGSEKLRVRGDELLISRLNPRKGHVFEAAPHEELSVASGEFAIMRPRDGITTRRFLFYYLTTPLVRASIDAGVQSATKSQQRVRFDRIWQTAIALPPLSEQHRIVALLDEMRSRIDNLCLRIGRQNALLRLRRQALITAAVAGRIQA